MILSQLMRVIDEWCYVSVFDTDGTAIYRGYVDRDPFPDSCYYTVTKVTIMDEMNLGIDVEKTELYNRRMTRENYIAQFGSDWH